MIVQHVKIAKTLRNVCYLLTAIVVYSVNYVLSVMIVPNVNLAEIVTAV